MIVNVQGDLPTIARQAVRASVGPPAERDVDIVTLATEIRRAEQRDDPNVVKAVGSEAAPGRLRSLYFTRARAPRGEGPLLRHIGLYAYRRAREMLAPKGRI
jgi:3-deoxy-manno-octulosonate cytidylyltransferase (CMP-KDO synthetase)